MKMLKTLSIALACGIIVALLTGLVPSTPGRLVGASWYGLPATWLIRLVIAPQYNPWRPNYVNLVLDIVFWFIVFAIILYAVNRLHKGKKRH